ncbi:MAG TPA: hypothetical protein VG847_15845 [Chitinophagaceae bacterium]|nr:hypothetical protein [Chitinophagaceae bacterium]
MERRFTTDELEQFLKQEADNFKMMPSKKVWHGIYNDIHPGRRWPSITISLLLISTLIFIGHMNTPNASLSHNQKSNNSGKNNSAAVTAKAGTDHKSPKDLNNQGTSQFLSGNNETHPAAESGASGITLEQPAADKVYNKAIDESRESKINVPKTNGNDIAVDQSNVPVLQAELSDQAIVSPGIDRNILPAEIEVLSAGSKNSEHIKEKILADNPVNFFPEKQMTIINDNLSAPAPAVMNKYAGETADDRKADKQVQSNVNSQKPKAISKTRRNYKLTYTYFFGPAVTNVSFRGTPISPSVFLSTNTSIMPLNYRVLNHAAFGFEAGAQMNYAFAPKWKFTAGLHLTYSGYNIRSNEMHPTVATLILRDPDSHVNYSRQYFSHYGDGTGLTPVNIKNHSLQASLPVGLQYQFFTGDKVQLNASGDIEPSIVLNSYAYLLSSDGRNYVNDPSLMRKANMASNFGVFLSFGSEKFTWQIGPVVRYQWFSTYKKDYTISEHLLNYGIRIGITPFRK